MSGLDMEMASGVAAFEAKEFARAMQLLQPLAACGVSLKASEKQSSGFMPRARNAGCAASTIATDPQA